jgi:hypothetical protein
MRKLVIAAAVGVIAAVALRLGTRGNRYAYGDLYGPEAAWPRVVPIIDGP